MPRVTIQIGPITYQKAKILKAYVKSMGMPGTISQVFASALSLLWNEYVERWREEHPDGEDEEAEDG